MNKIRVSLSRMCDEANAPTACEGRLRPIHPDDSTSLIYANVKTHVLYACNEVKNSIGTTSPANYQHVPACSFVISRRINMFPASRHVADTISLLSRPQSIFPFPLLPRFEPEAIMWNVIFSARIVWCGIQTLFMQISRQIQYKMRIARGCLHSSSRTFAPWSRA